MIRLCAARACEHPGLLISELDRFTGYACQGFMRQLQRKGLVEVQVKERSFLRWQATERGLKHLGLDDWKPELRAEEQARWLGIYAEALYDIGRPIRDAAASWFRRAA